MSPKPPRSRILPAALAGALAVALALGTAGCAGPGAAGPAAGGPLAPGPVRGAPSGRDGWLVYAVGGLRFEAPEAWRAWSDGRKLVLEAEMGTAKVEVSTPPAPFASPVACLDDAEAAIKKGESMERARRHPTTLGGARALAIEGDQPGWHVWAWVACDGRAQYRVFFSAKTPAPPVVLEALRTFQASARVGGEV